MRAPLSTDVPVLLLNQLNNYVREPLLVLFRARNFLRVAPHCLNAGQEQAMSEWVI